MSNFEIKLVQQRHKGDCVIACLAMVLGMDYVDIYNHYHKLYKDDFDVPNGISTRTERALLSTLGYENNYVVYSECSPLYFNRVYLLTVPSLNVSNAFHRIVVKLDNIGNWTIFDPSNKDKIYAHREQITNWFNTTEILYE